MHLAGGALIFGIFIAVYFVITVYSMYTRRGSAINQRPYGHAHGDTPGAAVPSTLAHDTRAATQYVRGTR
jgi:hypothetical protein